MSRLDPAPTASSGLARIGTTALRLACGLATLALATPVAAEAFRPALPGYRFAFPRDHAAHPDFRTEWWYYTGHLRAADGRAFGYQLTFFRVGTVPGLQLGAAVSPWRSDGVMLAHFAVSDLQTSRFLTAERLQRGGVGLAGAQAGAYDVFLGGWRASLAGSAHRLAAQDGRQQLALTLTPRKPVVIHGQQGVSRKSDCPTCSSHYYSLTRLDTQGTLTVAGETLAVTGQSWMDHEFGSNQMGRLEAGWDWFSLQLSDGSELMLYQLRRTDGSPVPQSSGTWVPATGPARHLPLKAFAIQPTGRWKSPATGGVYPLGWQLRVPEEDLDLTVTPAFEGQEWQTPGSTGETYWEGSVKASGTRRGKPLGGEGYVELTGYAR
ncbi:MAG: lipocalin-like domain-containing protein, partial [Candidatus Sericytochromatia bacterium]|nr:lipocalin-like domain-containing protein [Candidatus Sericytochromatia bacterium]